MEEYHKPVLLKEVIEALDVKKNGWYLDCTLGDGGHSLDILKLGGKVVGIDVDPKALERAGKRFETEEIDRNRWKLIVGNFRDLKNLINKPAFANSASVATSAKEAATAGKQAEPGNLRFKGILFDLGVSSLQLGSPERGFSFTKEGSLDMRMDPSLQVKALDLVNGLNKGELYELFNKLGEEKYSRAISDALVRARQVRPISSSKQLAEVVEKVVGRREKIHPATRIFQALRIAVNDELNALREGLSESLEVIKNNGHILVISYHSLEDRIVKTTFKKWGSEGLGQVLTKKPITPGMDEVRRNPRSRSAKMRMFKKAIS